MKNPLVERWNKSHLNIPKDKSVSTYAIDTEINFPRHSKVLDLGGGSGTDAIYFCEKEHNVTVADISDVALETAKYKTDQKGVTLETKQVILPNETLPFLDETFDIVYSRLALHYFDEKDTSFILSEVYRVLKKSGKVYFTVKSPEDKNEMEFLKKTSKEISENVFTEEGEMKSRYTKDQWKKIVESTKFNKIDIHDYIEDLAGRVDSIKSGNKSFILTEIILEK